MSLVKAKLIALCKGEQESFTVLFNPSEYSFDTKNSFEKDKSSSKKNILKSKGSCSKTFSMNLVFDTYGANESVKKYTDKLVNMVKPKYDEYKLYQPIIRFVWGDVFFEGIMKSISVKFTMFLESGTPVRANTTISIVQSAEKTDDKETQKNLSGTASESDNPRI